MTFKFCIFLQYFNGFVDGYMSLAILFKYFFSFKCLKLTLTDYILSLNVITIR